MFPTRSKTKISSSLAYPANAKMISEVLADVPQAQELSISFFYWQSTARIHQTELSYPVLGAEYSYHKLSQYSPHQFEESGLYEPQWRIWVQPVRSTLKHHVKELLQREALPKLHDWLSSHQYLTGKQESHRITV